MPSLHLDGQATLTDMFLKCDAIINSHKPIALIIVLRPDEHGLLAALSKKNCQMEQFNSQQFNSQHGTVPFTTKKNNHISVLPK